MWQQSTPNMPTNIIKLILGYFLLKIFILYFHFPMFPIHHILFLRINDWCVCLDYFGCFVLNLFYWWYIYCMLVSICMVWDWYINDLQVTDEHVTDDHVTDYQIQCNTVKLQHIQIRQIPVNRFHISLKTFLPYLTSSVNTSLNNETLSLPCCYCHIPVLMPMLLR